MTLLKLATCPYINSRNWCCICYNLGIKGKREIWLRCSRGLRTLGYDGAPWVVGSWRYEGTLPPPPPPPPPLFSRVNMSWNRAGKYEFVPRWPLQACQLSPAVRTELYQLRPKLSASCNRTRMSCIERYGYSKCPSIWSFLHSLIVHYFIHNYMHTYRSVEWYRQYTDVMLLSNVKALLKKIFCERWQANCVPNIAHFKLLLWSYEHAFSGKSFNAVSLTVPSTWPPNCVHIILIHSADSPVYISLTCCCFMFRSYSVVSPNMFDIW